MGVVARAWWSVCAAVVFCAAAWGAGVGGEDGGPNLLLVDDAKLPHVAISWPTKGGGVKTLEADREYKSPGEKTYLGENLECFVALGGTRLDKGRGHPAGAIVRVGFYKKDPKELMFTEIADGAEISVRLAGVHFNQPVLPRPRTVLQHLKYMQADLESCGLGLEAMDQFNTMSETDDLAGKIVATNGRFGILDGREGGGEVKVRREEDGSITLEARFPYKLLRHLQDPWQRELPGSFFEPSHFHFEVEVLPEDVAKAEEEKEKAETEHRSPGEADPETPGPKAQGTD